jgi:MCRA family
MGSLYRSRHELVFVFKSGKAPHINNVSLGGSVAIAATSGSIQARTASTARRRASCRCIPPPGLMPFITSQFMPRAKSDRPQVIPARYKNLAFTGQFCEQPDDVHRRILDPLGAERGLWIAGFEAKAAAGLSRGGGGDPRVLYHAFRALHDMVA